MAMLPVPLQTETRPSDGLAITWVGVSGAIRYGLIIGVQGVPMPDLDVIMRGQTKQFAILGVPARFTGVVDIGTPAGATRQFGLVAYRSDGGIFPISPLNIFPARSAPRDREYHAVVPPALVEVAPTVQSAQPVRAADPNDPWSVLEAASNAAPTPAPPVTFTAPQPVVETPSYTISQPSSTPTVPRTPAPYDPWDVLSQGSAASGADEEPPEEPAEEEASAADWTESPSFTEPTPSYAGYYEAQTPALPIEPAQRDEPPSEAVDDTVVSPVEEPVQPVVEPEIAFPEPVQFEPYRPAVVHEPEPQPVEVRGMDAEPVAAMTTVEEPGVSAPTLGEFAQAESAVPTTPAESEHSGQELTSAGGFAGRASITSTEGISRQAEAPDSAIDAERATTAETAGDTSESLSVSNAEELRAEAGTSSVSAPVSDSVESAATWVVSPIDAPSSAPITEDSGERVALSTSNDAEYQSGEPTAALTPADREDQAAPGAVGSGTFLATPALADRDEPQEPPIVAGPEKEVVAPTIIQASEDAVAPDVNPTWVSVESSSVAAEPSLAEPEPRSVSPRAESEAASSTDYAASAAPSEAWPAVQATPPVETRAEAPTPRPAEPAPIEREPEPPAPPLPADLGALLDEAELYLLPQWADSDAALSLVEQVEREAPGHPRTRAIRARIESMKSGGAVGADQGDSTQVAGLLEKASRCVDDRDYWGAVDYYEQALAEQPEHAEAQAGLAKARLRARWPSQLAGAGGDVAALRALGSETDAEAPDLAGQAYATAFGIQPTPDVLRLWLSAFCRAGYGGVLADTARRAVQVLEESGKILPGPAVTAALEGLEQTAGAGGADTQAAITRLCDELVGAGQ